MLQYLLVAAVVVVALLYVLRQTWRTWAGKGKGNCGGSCSCSGKSKPASASQPSSPLIPAEDLTARLRQRS